MCVEKLGNAGVENSERCGKVAGRLGFTRLRLREEDLRKGVGAGAMLGKWDAADVGRCCNCFI